MSSVNRLSGVTRYHLVVLIELRNIEHWQHLPTSNIVQLDCSHWGFYIIVCQMSS